MERVCVWSVWGVWGVWGVWSVWVRTPLVSRAGRSRISSGSGGEPQSASFCSGGLTGSPIVSIGGRA